jgi:hypothetical protein
VQKFCIWVWSLEFYDALGDVYDRSPKNDVKIVLGDINVQTGQEHEYEPTIGRHSLHTNTNDNGSRLTVCSII